MDIETIGRVNAMDFDEQERERNRRSLVTVRKLNEALRDANARLAKRIDEVLAGSRMLEDRLIAMQKANRALLNEARMAKADRDLAREDAGKLRVQLNDFLRAEQRRKDGPS